VGTLKLNGNLQMLVALRALAFSNVSTAFLALYIFKDLHTTLPMALQIFASLSLLGVFLEVPTGWLADRCGRRPSLIAGSMCCIVGLALLASSKNIGPRFICGVVMARTGWSMLNGADSALAADICDVEYADGLAKRAYRLFELQSCRFVGLSMAMGALLGSFLVWRWGLRSAVWAQDVAYLPMLICACLIKTPHIQRARVASAAKIFRTLPGRRPLLAIIGLSAVLGAFAGMMWNVIPAYWADVHIENVQLPSWGLGLFWSSLMAIQFVVRPSWASGFNRRFGQYGSIGVLMAMGIGCYIAVGSRISVFGLALVAAVFLIGPLSTPQIQLRLCELSVPQERATILSIRRTVALLAVSLGGLMVSTATRLCGLSVSILLAGGVLGVIGVLALRLAIRAERTVDGRYCLQS
jgi:MFS family permease